MRWQVKKRAIGFRPRILALPSVATMPNERWATDLCRDLSGRPTAPAEHAPGALRPGPAAGAGAGRTICPVHGAIPQPLCPAGLLGRIRRGRGGHSTLAALPDAKAIAPLFYEAEQFSAELLGSGGQHDTGNRNGYRRRELDLLSKIHTRNDILCHIPRDSPTHGWPVGGCS